MSPRVGSPEGRNLEDARGRARALEGGPITRVPYPSELLLHSKDASRDVSFLPSATLETPRVPEIAGRPSNVGSAVEIILGQRLTLSFRVGRDSRANNLGALSRTRARLSAEDWRSN
jgi:hypothetical protein